MKKYLILPVKNPTKEFLKIINFFHDKIKIIIINDGSQTNSQFFKLSYKKALIIKNKKNMGKGFSIKKAFRFILKKKRNIDGAIIADSDGQHSINDINKILKLYSKNSNKFIIGQRKFRFFKTPLRNFVGNSISSFIFFIRFGIYIDTQCGLRAIPLKYMEKSTKIKANDYSFESQLLIDLLTNHKEHLKFMKIKTIYKKKIKSYFDPIFDTYSIFLKLLK
jgi:hypothetical protein